MFASVASLLSPGGIFVLERQRIGSYASSRRALAKEGFYLDANGLKIHPDDFDLILTVEMGLIGPISVGEIEGNGESKARSSVELSSFFFSWKPRSLITQSSLSNLFSSSGFVRPLDIFVQPRKLPSQAVLEFRKACLDAPRASASSAKSKSESDTSVVGLNGEEEIEKEEVQQVLVPWVKRKWRVK